MNTGENIVLCIVPGMFILLSLIAFFSQPAYIRRRSVVPFLALIVASAFFYLTGAEVRGMASTQEKLKRLSKIAFFLSVALIIDTVRYGDFQEAIRSALLFVAGIMISSTKSIVWVGLGGLISGGTGLWETVNPPEQVRNRTVGYLPEALWHLAKVLLMFLVAVSDFAAFSALVKSV